MLVSLHVKDLALIREAEVFFGSGLNVLTGETGAGKSLVIGSVNIALGGKTAKDIVRSGASEAIVELVFDAEGDAAKKAGGGEDLLILQRRIRDGRSIARINGSTVTAAELKAVSDELIDIHGQHEHQSLLYKKNHRIILDDFAGGELKEILGRLSDRYREYMDIRRELDSAELDEEGRRRQADLISYEINEIEAAALKKGEDEELEEKYRRMKNFSRISEAMETVVRAAGYESDESAGNTVGIALRAVNEVKDLDGALESIASELGDLDSLIGDLSREVNDYMKNMEFSGEEFAAAEERLDLINHLKAKYGGSIEKISEGLEDRKKELARLDDYDAYRDGLKERLNKAENELKRLCAEASGKRKEAASRLSGLMMNALADLNFLEAEFVIEVRPDENRFTSEGYDDVEFMISMNPGEKIRPLKDVASGGELSRIMLALKTVIADEDKTGTLIFDEIDTGISGRTAQKVAEKLNILSRRHQVICITHLPQIAAMADHHFVITKTTDGSATQTNVRELDEEETTEELSRLLSGAEVTDTVRENAAEMKSLANSLKKR